MNEARIMVSNGSASYRDTLAHTLRVADVEVTVVEPGLFDAWMARVEPDLVICDCGTERAEAGVRSWVEMYAEHGPPSVVCVGGHRSELGVTNLDALLGIVDRIQGLNPPDDAEDPGASTRSPATGGAVVRTACGNCVRDPGGSVPKHLLYISSGSRRRRTP